MPSTMLHPDMKGLTFLVKMLAVKSRFHICSTLYWHGEFPVSSIKKLTIEYGVTVSDLKVI